MRVSELNLTQSQGLLKPVYDLAIQCMTKSVTEKSPAAAIIFHDYQLPSLEYCVSEELHQ